jgi:hypothetical protein
MFRAIDESSQQALLFKQGYSSYSILKEDAGSFATDPELAKYMQPSIAETNTRYTIFNMADDNNSALLNESNDDSDVPTQTAKGSSNRIFTQNINFRKAMMYAFDRGNSLTLAGVNEALPSRSFTPTGMGALPNAEFDANDVDTSVFSSMESTYDKTTGSNAGTYSAKDN